MNLEFQTLKLGNIILRFWTLNYEIPNHKYRIFNSNNIIQNPRFQIYSWSYIPPRLHPSNLTFLPFFCLELENLVLLSICEQKRVHPTLRLFVFFNRSMQLTNDWTQQKGPPLHAPLDSSFRISYLSWLWAWVCCFNSSSHYILFESCNRTRSHFFFLFFVCFFKKLRPSSGQWARLSRRKKRRQKSKKKKCQK